MKEGLVFLFLLVAVTGSAQKKRIRDHGITIGVLKPGPHNAITDVPGVKVGHVTLHSGDSIRTGVTAILPHDGNIFQNKVPAAIYVANGFGKLAGSTQVAELGNLETPIVLTNTLSVADAVSGLVTYSMRQKGNGNIRSVNAVVGETNDGWLNDIRGRHVKEEHVLTAIRQAADGPVTEGNVGAGTGTVCFGFKGGIGTSSRILPASLGGYTVGVLVQTNFGGVLEIAGVPVGKELGRYPFQKEISTSDGSCMIVVLTDAPLGARNLERLARRAVLGLGKTGGIASNGSGDYVIAASTAIANRILHEKRERTDTVELLRNDNMTPLFLAVIEATEEAILNSLFTAEPMKGRAGHIVEALPVGTVIEILKKYNRIN